MFYKQIYSDLIYENPVHIFFVILISLLFKSIYEGESIYIYTVYIKYIYILVVKILN